MARNGLAHSEPYLWAGKYMVFNGQMVHRLVWESYNGAIPIGYLVHHKNGNRFDNQRENLEMMTLADHCKIHLPRLGTGLPPIPITICAYCGNKRGEREMVTEPRRRKCNKCRGKEEVKRRKERYVPSLSVPMS